MVKIIFYLGIVSDSLLHHSTHTAHTGSTSGEGGLGSGFVADDALSGEEHTSHRGRIFEGYACDLGGIDDTGSAEVAELTGLGVVAVVALKFAHLIDDDGTFLAGIEANLAEGLFNGTADDGDAGVLVGILAGEASEGLLGADIGYATAGDDTFLNGGTGGTEGVIATILLLFLFGLGSSTNLEDAYAAGKFGEALLKFLLVIGRGGGCNLTLYLGDALVDEFLLTSAIYDGGVFLADGNLLGLTEHSEGGLLEGETLLLADDHAAGEGGDIFKHSLAAVAEAGSLDSANLKARLQTVNDEGGESFGINILSDDEQGTACLYGRFEDGEEILEVGNLLVVDKDVGILHLALHLLGIGDEIGGEIATIELHTFHGLEYSVATLGILNGNDAVDADGTHTVGNEFTYFWVVVGGDSSHLLNLGIVVADFFALGLDVLHDSTDGEVDAALDVEGVGTCCHILHTLGKDSLGEDGGGGGAVAGIVASLGGNALDELRTGILKGVFKFDFLGHADTVLGDARGTELLIDYYIASLGTEGYLDGVGQLVGTRTQLLASICTVFDIFCHFFRCLVEKLFS